MFPITNIKFCVSLISLSTKENKKLLQKLKSGFKRTVYWNKYLSKVTLLNQNQYLDF